MIKLSNVQMIRGSRPLLDDANLVIHRSQRIGMIGRNGCGKSTFFQLLAGNFGVEEGNVSMPGSLRCSMMAQETPARSRTALDFVIDAHTEYRALEQEIIQTEQIGDGSKLAALHAKMDALDGYDITHRAEILLSGLGFSSEQFRNTVASFSGGWRVRLNLAVALLCPSDLLLLDEPTNHLDLEATVWLENWLQRYQGTLLLISHDRSFLDAVVDHIIHFDGLKLIPYKGNYSEFERLRAQKLSLQQAMYEKQQKRREQIESFVRRFRYKDSKARQAQSRLRELQRMQDIAPAHVDSPFSFQFRRADKYPSFLTQVENLSIGFTSVLVEGINLSLQSDTRVGLLGFNGSGKSTLLKVLAGQMAPLQGELQNSRNLKIGYYAQHQVDDLDTSSSARRIIQKLDDERSEQEIRDFLGGFNFDNSRVEEPVGNFSGGEKARLALARIVWQKPNLLLLDEPTNHLDLEMVHALTVALQQYQGGMILVSHDRHLLTNTVDQFWSIHQGRFSEFRGNISDYEQWLRQTSAETQPPNEGKPDRPGANKKKIRQDAANRRLQLAPLRKQNKVLEAQLETLHQELSGIDRSLADVNLYAGEEKDRLNSLVQRQAAVRRDLRRKEEEWLAAQEALQLASLAS